jgi:hypothetical protein
VAEDLFGSSRSVWALGAIFACSHVKGVYFYILFMSLVYAELSRMTHDPSLFTFSHSHILTFSHHTPGKVVAMINSSRSVLMTRCTLYPP